MTDRNKQEQTETEVADQTLSEFLQNTPPNQLGHISDLAVPEYGGPYPPIDWVIKTPVLELHCPDDSCNGVRFFRCAAVQGEGKHLKQGATNNLYVSYQCSNCKKNSKSIFFGGEN